MDPRGVAQALLLFFAVAALFLFLTVVCLVALVSRHPWRRSGVRRAIWAFPAAAVVPAAGLALLFGTRRYSQMETGLSCGLALLVVAGCALVAHAFSSSRKTGG